MKNIAIWGYYGSGNIGDNILLEVIVDQIKNSVPDSIITVVCTDINMMQDLPIEKRVCNIKSTTRIGYLFGFVSFYTQFLKENKIIIYGGGTQIFDNCKYSWRGIFPKALVLIVNRFFYKRKIIHYGVGIGSINTFLGKFFTYIICNNSDFFIVRDPSSYEKLRKYRVPKNKILLSRDLTYGMASLQKNDGAKNEKIKIGFSLFEYYKHTEKNNSKSIELNKNIVQTLEGFLNHTSYDIYIFSFQKKYGNDDESYSQHLKTVLNSKRVKVVSYSNDWREVISILREMDYCIGMRYHFLLLAMKFNIPVIALNYSVKVESELAMFGLSNYVIELDNITYEKISSLLEKIIDNHEIKLLLKTGNKKIKKSIEKAQSIFLSIIDDNSTCNR